MPELIKKKIRNCDHAGDDDVGDSRTTEGEGTYRLSHIKFHKARGRRLYCNTPTTDNAVKFNM